MTELKKLQALANSVGDFLEKVSGGEDIAVEKEEVLEQDFLLRDSLFVRTEKLLNKINDVDPVTEKPRYGRNHCEKVQLLHEKVSNLISRMEEVLSAANNSAPTSSSVMKEETDKITTPSSNESANIFSLNSTFTYNQRLHDMESTLMQAKEGELEVNLDLLKDEKENLRHLIARLHAQAGKFTFHQTFEETKARYTSTDEPEPEVVFRAMHAFLKSVITNICSRPEDENLRRIRLCHPVVFSKVIGHDGGLELLLTMGFQVTTAPMEAERPEEVQSFVDKYSSTTIRGSPAPGLQTLATLLHLSDLLGQEIFLTMVEPSVKDVKAWAEWWDSLTLIRSYL